MELPIVVAILALITSCTLAVEHNNVMSADPMQASLDTPDGFDGKALINSESGNEETAKKPNSALDDADVGFGRYSISKSANNKELGRLSRRNENSIWCPVAVKCKRTNHPICGFDDKIGLAKFNDICHMLEVNCYWKYNFSVAPCG